MKAPRYGDKYVEKEADGCIRLYEKARPNKRAPEYWVVMLEWRDPANPTKRLYDSAPNWPRARELARQIKRDLEEGNAGSGTTIAFGRAHKEWLDHREKQYRAGAIRGTTWSNERWCTKYYLPELKDKKLASIYSLDIEKWALSKANKLKRNSLQNPKNSIYAVFDFGVRRKWISRNPLRDDPITLPGKSEKRPDIPQYADIEALIQLYAGPKANWTWRAWPTMKISFALAAFGGLRRGEISALRWDKIDLVNTRLHIPKETGGYTRVDGIHDPKTAASVRTVPLCQYLYDALLDHAHATGRDGYVCKYSRQPGINENRPLDSEELSRLHRQAMKHLGLVKPDGKVKFTLHALRHWYASACLAIGVKLLPASKRVGHAKPSITTDIYGHVFEGDEDGLSDAVDPIWHERLARAKTDMPRIIDGTANGVRLIEGTATVLDDGGPITAIPANADPWIVEAVRLLEGGWRIPRCGRAFQETPNRRQPSILADWSAFAPSD
jgi:integrase